MSYRQVVDCLLREFVESHFISVKHSGSTEGNPHFKGEEVFMAKSVTENSHVWSCPNTRNAENLIMSAPFWFLRRYECVFFESLMGDCVVEQLRYLPFGGRHRSSEELGLNSLAKLVGNQ